ncbi:hypothetical protein LOC69_13090 [Blastopirellula sp. JC733]|nr:hypothetical protein [Blastopirellula sediminis]
MTFSSETISAKMREVIIVEIPSSSCGAQSSVGSLLELPLELSSSSPDSLSELSDSSPNSGYFT